MFSTEMTSSDTTVYPKHALPSVYITGLEKHGRLDGGDGVVVVKNSEKGEGWTVKLDRDRGLCLIAPSSPSVLLHRPRVHSKENKGVRGSLERD